MRLFWITAAAVSATFGVAAPSQAAMVVALDRWEKDGPHRDVYVTAGPGEANDITVEVAREDIGTRVTDRVPLEAGFGCRLEPDASVVCPQAGARLKVDVGDLDDRVTLRAFSPPSQLLGGDGDDVLTTSDSQFASAVVTGGDGDDRIISGALSTDTFLEGPAPNGGDTIDGGRGDVVSYRERSRAVHVDLEGDADDGEAGERDRIGAGVSGAVGGAGADTLIGDSGPNFFDGRDGADLLVGGGGTDRLRGDASQFAARGFDDRIYAGAGSDHLVGGGGDDLLRGGRGRDGLSGGAGRDRLFPGPGGLNSRGGPGNDVIVAAGGSVDVISCGPGWDRVTNDDFDLLRRRGCERHDPL